MLSGAMGRIADAMAAKAICGSGYLAGSYGFPSRMTA